MINSLPNGYVHGERERGGPSFLVFISFIDKGEGEIEGREREI